ncbi:DNA-3-methyladenine glycosylase [Streptomyces prasinopilosus]|uniref:DNA-3-methyladenine glycosylase n=1 Tax=Streptomyces prasinopilosus TaxID=67344 RepID=A0A1G6KKI3_9ACTN|nr:DNA-3-methyladenine glycosylase [Streptomyces prasinopilosus]
MIATPDRTPLLREFFDRPVLGVAPGPLGRLPVRATPDGPITLRPTAAGSPDAPDAPGSHTRRIRTARNGVTSGPPGHAHVYCTHGTSRRSA